MGISLFGVFLEPEENTEEETVCPTTRVCRIPLRSGNEIFGTLTQGPNQKRFMNSMGILRSKCRSEYPALVGSAGNGGKKTECKNPFGKRKQFQYSLSAGEV